MWISEGAAKYESMEGTGASDRGGWTLPEPCFRVWGPPQSLTRPFGASFGSSWAQLGGQYDPSGASDRGAGPSWSHVLELGVLPHL